MSSDILPLDESVSVEFHGHIIHELSEQLPSDLIALNELIKNAYDASATLININLDTIRQTLTIHDNGCGMSRDVISNLFHLGRSSKQYGQPFLGQWSNDVRFTQGSKGLGFLAALRFGEHVTWSTKREEEPSYQFSCPKADICEAEELSKYRIPLQNGKLKNHGTKIIIQLDAYHFKNIHNSLTDKKIVYKIMNAFRQASLKIAVSIDGSLIKTNKIGDFLNLVKDRQLFYVKFSQQDNEILIYHAGDEVLSLPFPSEYISGRYNIEGELLILDLTNSSTQTVSELFHNNQEKLAPLIYINDNLFNNNELFDPDIQRRVQSSKALPQIIGYIDVICNDPELGFNPDRTQFVQNQLTDQIKDCLKTLNKTIQTEASKKKSELPMKKPPFQPAPPVGGICAARFCFSSETTYPIPSEQINLYTLIKSATDSTGQTIPHKEILISIDGEPVKNAILESVIYPCRKTIEYKYVDCNTGSLTRHLILTFASKSIGTSVEPLLPYLPKPSRSRLMILVRRMMDQINSLSVRKKRSNEPKYYEIIACSLRALFEMSCDSLKDKPHIPPDLRKGTKVAELIGLVIKHISTDKNTRNYIASNSDFDYLSLGNFQEKAFLDMYKKSHLGAHKGKTYLTNEEIKDIALKASKFACLVDLLHQKGYDKTPRA